MNRHAGHSFRNLAAAMPIRFRTSGCLFSIIASLALTLLLNLMIRGCS